MEQTLDFKDLMLGIYRRLGALQRDEICCDGVTVSQCYTLQFLFTEGEKTACELATALGIDASTQTRTIDVLVRNGSVERVRPETGDRRRVILRLTKEGRTLARKLLACGDTLFTGIMDRFSKRERPVVMRALGAVLEALDAVTEGRCGESACK